MFGRAGIAERALVLAAIFAFLGGALGCGATYNEARKVDGQVYYTERPVPDVGERFAHSLTHDCKGGVRDDQRALKLVPSTDACRREQLVVSYIVDGVHRVEACAERWKIRCNKTPGSRSSSPMAAPPVTVSQGPLDCVVECTVEDHFATQ